MASLFRSGYLSWLLATPAGLACCVAGNTRVRTLSGEVAAGALVVGDLIVSVDPVACRAVHGRIVHIRRAVRECLALRWDGGELICTPEHPLLSPETGTYRPAADWVTGSAQTLLAWTPDGCREVVVRATATFAGMHEVIDLSVEAEPHNFVASGVVVHNKLPLPEPRHEADAAGPTVELDADALERRFRVRACIDGDDVADPDLSFRAEYDATALSSEPANTQTLATYVDVDTVQLYRQEVTVPDMWQIEGDFPPPSCSEGLVFVFGRDPEPPAGSIRVTWNVIASIPEDAPEDVTALEVTIEPEP